MKTTRQQVLSILSRMLKDGTLPKDRPISIFIAQPDQTAPRQLVIIPKPDRALVKTSRLPFARPMSFEWWELT